MAIIIQFEVRQRMTIFITGTDTNIGKTFITGLLAKFFSDKGLMVEVQKWASTGRAEYSDDISFIYRLMGRGNIPAADSMASPYCFSFPASPHLAAELEGRSIEKKRLADSARLLSGQCDILLIEGAGGIMVPLTHDLLTIDLVKELDLPIIVTARSGLGTLNHTLLTLEAIKRRNIHVLCVILNNQSYEEQCIIDDNLKILKEFSDVSIFGPLPRVAGPEDALAFIEPMGLYLLGHFKQGLIRWT